MILLIQSMPLVPDAAKPPHSVMDEMILIYDLPKVSRNVFFILIYWIECDTSDTTYF